MPPKQPPLPPPVGAGNRGRSNRPSPNKAVSEADKKSTRLTKGNQAAAATKRAKKATETAKGTAQEPLEVTDQDNPEANAEENEDMTNDVAALVGDEQEGPTKDPASDDSVQAMNSTDDDRAGSIINEAELPPADKDQERPTEAGALTKWILEVARASSGPGQWHDVGRILVKFPDIQRKAVLVKNIRGQYPTINRFRQNNVTGPLAQILLPDTVGEQAKCTLTENGAAKEAKKATIARTAPITTDQPHLQSISVSPSPNKRTTSDANLEDWEVEMVKEFRSLPDGSILRLSNLFKKIHQKRIEARMLEEEERSNWL